MRVGQLSAQRLRVGPPVVGDAAGQRSGQVVESRDQPGAFGSGRVGVGQRYLVPAQGVQQPGGIAAEAPQQRLTRCAFDGELPDAAERTPVPADEVEVENICFAGDFTCAPPSAAVEPARHLLTKSHLPVPQRQEQVVDALFDRQLRWERGEGDAGAQIHQHRMHRLVAELIGQLFADEQVADGLTLGEPQRFQGTGPGRPPRQLHVGEGLEQILRAHAVAPLDRLVDRILRRRMVTDTAHDRSVGVQRPFAAAFPERAAVHLEAPFVTISLRPQGQLDLARSLLGQDDRFVKDDVAHLRRCADRRERHRRIRRPGDDDGPVDDMVGQPRL
nr:hypothetical protein CPGR_04914 [Mycolicibacterium malmesburyense]